MRGTIKDLRMAEELATKGRYGDALKVVDRMMGVSAQANGRQKVEAIRAAILSKEPLLGDEPEVVDRPDGLAQISFNVGRLKLDGEWAGELLILRTRWLVSYLNAARSQEVLVLSLQDMSVLGELLQDPVVKERITPDDQATLLAMSCDPFFVTNDYETVQILMQSALFRAPANTVVLGVLRSLVGMLRGNLQKDNPSALANREKYRGGLGRLEPLLLLAETAAEVVGSGPLPDTETIKRKVTERLNAGRPAAPPPAAAPSPAPPAAPASPPAEKPKKPGFLGRLFGKS